MPRKKRLYCADPLNIHKRKIVGTVRQTPESVEIHSENADIKLAKGTPLCLACRQRCSAQPLSVHDLAQPSTSAHGADELVSSATSSSSTTTSHNISLEHVILEESEDETRTQAYETVNKVLTTLDQTPVKLHGLSESQKRRLGKRKFRRISQEALSEMSHCMGLDLTPDPSPAKKQKLDDEQDLAAYSQLMEQLKSEFQATADYRRRLKILTLSPFSIKRTASFFQTSMYMVKKSRKIREERGILPEVPKLSKGQCLTEDDKRYVTEFYESDEISRVCPGARDFVTVRNANGEKEKKQKRLILGNLREIYVVYKDSRGEKSVGFSSFAALRPKHCVFPGPAGTHTVCVCLQHQNTKLMVEALGVPGLSYHDLMDFSVCDVENTDCMLGECPRCPGAEGVLSYLNIIEDEYGEDFDESVTYKQWVSTDRCTLLDQIESREDFMAKLSENIVKLNRHHLISKTQGRVFAKTKQDVGEHEAVVVGDFSENYSFVVQHAVQGWHWDSTQATVHPFVAYFQEEGKVVHQSYCVISDGLKHNAAMVHCFLKELVPALKDRIPGLRKINYFSDGCAAQYKNRFNFVNICQHKQDFDVDCEWHFFGTSHGKNSCDAIGGTVKRATARESLIRSTQGQIITAQAMYEFLSEKFVSDICVLFVSNAQVLEVAESLRKRFANAVTVKGTQHYHKFSPTDERCMMVYEMSTVNTGKRVHVLRK